jgi:hypothetical protein
MVLRYFDSRTWKGWGLDLGSFGSGGFTCRRFDVGEVLKEEGKAAWRGKSACSRGCYHKEKDEIIPGRI